MSRPRRWLWRPIYGDWVLAVALTVLAALIRYPHTQLIPRFSDELEEIVFAYKIAQGGFWPAVSIDEYNGPLYHYLVALGLSLVGGAAWPRWLAWLLGTLTVGVTYFLGARLALVHVPPSPDSRHASPVAYLAGALAALFMAVAFVHIIIHSRMAWSNSTTPFWTALFLWAIVETRRQERPALLLLAAGLGALALQTHPSFIAVLAGAGLWLALTRPTWLRTRWPWLASLVLLLGVSNLVGYNLVTQGRSVEFAATQRDYGFSLSTTASEYGANLRGFLGIGYQVVSSTLLIWTLHEEPRLSRLWAPEAIAYGLATCAALVYTARRAGIGLACWLAALLIFPFFNRSYGSFSGSRYLALLLPITFASLGVLLATGLVNAWHTWSTPSRRRWSWPLLLGGVALTLSIGLPLYSVRELEDYYSREYAAHRTNARLWQVMHIARHLTDQGHEVWLDRDLRSLRLSVGGGDVFLAFRVLMDIDRIPHDAPHGRKLKDAPMGTYLILSKRHRDQLGQHLLLTPLDWDEPPLPASPNHYWVYQVVGRHDMVDNQVMLHESSAPEAKE